MNDNSEICCVIVTFNGSETVEKQISELVSECKIVIVDNGSDELFVQFLESLRSRYSFELIINTSNLGLAHALNQGLDYASSKMCKYILTLDQDSFFTKSNLKTMSLAFEIDRRIASVGPSYKKNSKSSFVNFLITSGNMVLVDVLNSIGGFDEKLFIDNIDIELSFRLLTNHYKIYLCGDAFIEHKIGEFERSPVFRIKYLSHGPERFYWMYRNERYLLRKYRKKLRLLCLKSFIASFIGILKVLFIERNKKRKMGNIFRGLKDGKLLPID